MQSEYLCGTLMNACLIHGRCRRGHDVSFKSKSEVNLGEREQELMSLVGEMHGYNHQKNEAVYI